MRHLLLLTWPALSVSDAACVYVDAVAAAFAASVSDAINAASKAAFAKGLITGAVTTAPPPLAGRCLPDSRSDVPPCRTYLFYSTSLRMQPITRILNPIPYVPNPSLHALEKRIRGGGPRLAVQGSTTRALCTVLQCRMEGSNPPFQRQRSTRSSLLLCRRHLSLHLQWRSTVHCPHWERSALAPIR